MYYYKLLQPCMKPLIMYTILTWSSSFYSRRSEAWKVSSGSMITYPPPIPYPLFFILVGYIRVCEQGLRVLVLQVGQEDRGTWPDKNCTATENADHSIHEIQRQWDATMSACTVHTILILLLLLAVHVSSDEINVYIAYNACMYSTHNIDITSCTCKQWWISEINV